jgi:hypothetical protein
MAVGDIWFETALTMMLDSGVAAAFRQAVGNLC